MPIHVTTTTTQSLSNKTFVDRLSTTGVVYASGGNSNQWNNVYSTVQTTSGSWGTGGGGSGAYLPLSGGTLTGTLNVSGDDTLSSSLENYKLSFSDTSQPTLITTFDKDELNFSNNSNFIQGRLSRSQLYLLNSGFTDSNATVISPNQVDLSYNISPQSNTCTLNHNKLTFSYNDSDASITKTFNLQSNVNSQPDNTTVDVYLPNANGTLVTDQTVTQDASIIIGISMFI